MKIHLIINADDYGYFQCVSRGILEASQARCLTATGIIANSPDLKLQLQWLNGCENLDCGVHLNLTHGKPLTSAMTDELSRWQGRFPNAYALSLLISTGKISLETVRREWSAQIEACQSQKLYFLNSHEHVHMLPALFELTRELGQTHQIPHIRLTRPEWLAPIGFAGLIRNSLMQIMHRIDSTRIKTRTPLFIGLSRSGKIDLNYLEMIFSKLQPGETYELMCHPGRFDTNEISDPKLKAYHDWQGELDTLQSPELKALYERFGIRLSHYHDLKP